LITRIKERLGALGIAEREASRRAGFSLGYVGDIISGRSKSPEMSRLVKLSAVLDCDVEYLIGTQDSPRKGGSAESRSFRQAGDGNALLELYSAQGLATSPWFLMCAEPSAKVGALPQLANVVNAYAVTVPTNHNEPRYGAGDVVYVNPALPPREGDSVFVCRTDGTAAIGKLEKFNGGVRIGFLKPGVEATTIPLEEIRSIHRIVGAVSP
jgi:transcriptional regulator with XRE-family HTH domain